MNKKCRLSGYILISMVLFSVFVSFASAEDVYTEQEQQMLDLINEERRNNGLEPLTLDPVLTLVAREHSKEMIEKDYFSHESFDGTLFSERIRDAGYPIYRIAENIAMNCPPDVVQAHENLMNSPGHRANILNSDYNEIGIGIWIGEYSSYSNTAMYTQDFGWDPDTTTPLSINFCEPSSIIIVSDTGDQFFSIRTSDVCDIEWSVDGSVVKKEYGVTLSSCDVLSASSGEHDIEVSAVSSKGSDSFSWLLEVVPTESMKGDFDGDKDVDFDDFVEFAEVYESSSQDANYSQIFDFDDDGDVDFDDFVEFAGIYEQ